MKKNALGLVVLLGLVMGQAVQAMDKTMEKKADSMKAAAMQDPKAKMMDEM